MQSKLKLYSYFRSSCSYRVRIALNIKNIPHELIPTHLLKNGGQQNSSEYRALNPQAQVPALADGPNLIAQSMAILEYLEEIFPSPRLLPTQAVDRARVRQFCELINSGIQPMQNLSLTQYLTGPANLSEVQKNAFVQHWVHKGMSSVENFLHKHAGTYCYGDQITLADCLLIPQVFSSKRFGVDMANYPKADTIYKHCMQLTDFIKASPEKQPDYEP